MKAEWKSFLENAGAVIENGLVSNFGNIQREQRIITTGNIIVDLSHLGLISAHGDDTETFLQGQLTNDVSLVNEDTSQLSGFCTPKGRLLAIMRLFRKGDSTYLQLPTELLEPVIKRLRMYVLASEVTLEDAGCNFTRIGVSGPEADVKLKEVIGEIPANPDEVVNINGVIILRVPGIHPRFEIIGDTDAIANIWDSLDVHAAPVGSGAWRLLDILAGIPAVYEQTSEAFVPQMANMHFLNGVSFKKGCYTGQEIVARMQYLGKLKRRMYRCHIDTNELPQPGAALFAENDTSGQGTGKIVDAQPSADEGIDALAVIQISSAENEVIHLGDTHGPILEFAELPYPVETEPA